MCCNTSRDFPWYERVVLARYNTIFDWLSRVNKISKRQELNNSHLEVSITKYFHYKNYSLISTNSFVYQSHKDIHNTIILVVWKGLLWTWTGNWEYCAIRQYFQIVVVSMSGEHFQAFLALFLFCTTPVTNFAFTKKSHLVIYSLSSYTSQPLEIHICRNESFYQKFFSALQWEPVLWITPRCQHYTMIRTRNGDRRHTLVFKKIWRVSKISLNKWKQRTLEFRALNIFLFKSVRFQNFTLSNFHRSKLIFLFT